MRPTAVLLVAGLATLAVGTLAAPATPREQGRAGAAPPVLGVTASEVAVDFVVRDKKGRIVRDLEPADVEVLEDGVRQEIALFQLVTTDPASAPAATTAVAPTAAGSAPAPSAPPAPDVEREAVVALVFDRLSPTARRTAHDAALAWLKLPAVRGRQVGVFRIDQGLDELQPFTDERGPVMDALSSVLRTVPTTFHSREDREKLRTLRQQIALVEGRVLSPGGPGSAADSGAGLVVPEGQQGRSRVLQEVARRQMATEVAMLQALEILERDQQGLTTTNALLALVSGLRTLPGRKAVVFFSEGLVLPDRVVATLASVISEANRGGVSFYAADAAGLRVRSSADETRREVATMADVIGSASETDNTLGGQQSMTRLMERNEDVLRFDPASGLGALARETGGFLISDTNNIELGLRRVEEELGSYYLLSYAPRNEAWDGRYRRIEVRARRSGLTVQARRGYYAVRTPMPTPVLDYEAPVLAQLELAPQAAAIPVHSLALQFPAEAGDTTVALVAELPGGAPSLVPDGRDGTLRQDFTVMALVRDAGGRVVHKASRRYSLAWPGSKAGQVRSGRVLFEREALLPPGRYTVETVAWDALGHALGVHRAPLVLAPPAPAAGLRVGSLMVVGHAEKRAAGEPGPLQYQGLQLYPSLGEPVHAGPGRPLAFLVTLRAGQRPLTDGTVELLRGESVVRRSAVPLPPPDETGLVRVVSGLPVDDVAPGSYSLRLVLSDGRQMATRTAELTLAAP
jgi:VWFA-related protein